MVPRPNNKGASKWPIGKLVVLNWRKIQAFSLIALIVLFFSGGPGISNLENDVRALCSEVSDLKKVVEGQTKEIQRLREKLGQAAKEE